MPCTKLSRAAWLMFSLLPTGLDSGYAATARPLWVPGGRRNYITPLLGAIARHSMAARPE